MKALAVNALNAYKHKGFKSLDAELQREILSSLLEMYQSGAAIKEIEIEPGKSKSTIHKILSRTEGFVPRPVTHKAKI